MNENIKTFCVPADMESELIDALRSDFSVTSLVDFANQECDCDFTRDGVSSYVAGVLRDEFSEDVISCRGSNSEWIEIPLNDELLDMVGGGEANVVASVNVLAAVNVVAAVTAVAVLSVVAAVGVVVTLGIVVFVAEAPGGGFCCFPKGTRVRRSDGVTVPIESVPIGGALAAPDGCNHVLEKIACTVQAGDRIYQINGKVECTWEQLFLSEVGNWLAVDLNGYLKYRAWKRETNPEFGLEDESVHQMCNGDRVHLVEGIATILSLSYRVVSSPETLHSFVLDGSRTFFANDFVVESRVTSDCFDFATLGADAH